MQRRKERGNWQAVSVTLVRRWGTGLHHDSGSKTDRRGWRFVVRLPALAPDQTCAEKETTECSDSKSPM